MCRVPPGEATLVLALGNPLRGDDGVGAAVLEQLKQNRRLPPQITLLDGGTAGLETVLLLQDYSRTIIIDAAEIGGAPGDWRRFTPSEVKLQAADPQLSGTLHYAGLAEALALAEALGVLPAEIVIYGVQPADIGWTPGLSEAVQAAIPAICTDILKLLCEELHHNPKVERLMAKILIIDDDPDMRLANRLVLEEAEYEVVEASNSTEGLKMIKADPPDLIVLDVMMDSTTEGFQTALALRSRDPDSEYAEYRDIPIIMLTAIHDTTSVRFAPDEDYLPVEAFIDKPVDPDKLIPKVKELLAEKG